MIASQFAPEQKRVKVLHVITHLGVGGALDNTLLTVKGLPRERYQVDLTAGHLPVGEGYTSWEERSRECADHLHLVPDLVRAVKPFRDYRACRQLANLIRQQGYQIVHTHCSKAGVLGRIAAHWARVPVVVHTCHAFGSQVTRDSNGSAVRRLASAVKSRVFVQLEKYAGSLSDQLITVAEQNKRQAIEQRLAPLEKIVTIYSGIDMDLFDVTCDRNQVLQSLECDPTRPVVALIGRLAPQKAPLDFVTAARLVLKNRPDVQFLIAGDGPLLDEVNSAIANEPAIKWIGFYDRVPELMSAIDVLALSSLWEGLGRSVTEAMIMGVPVAATAVDGVPELVSHETTGLLSEPRDPESLAKNILRLIDKPEEAQSMAQRAKNRVVPEFGADRMVERIDELYQSLLSERGRLSEPQGDCLAVAGN